MNWLCNTDEYADRLAIWAEDGQQITFQELRRVSEKSADTVSKEDLVLLECDNSVSSLVSYVGLMGKGIPAILVDKNLAEALKATLVKHYQVSAVIAGGKTTRLATSGPQMHPDLAILLSTSGSTGSPKLVRLANRNLLANARQISCYLGITQNSRAITVLPQQYSFGLSVIHSHLLNGASLVLTNQGVTERGFWELFRNSQTNSFSGVPATFELLRKLRFERMDLPNLKTVTQAGGRLAKESVEYFAKLGNSKGFDFYVMYGQTEATARMAYLPPSENLTRADSIGKAIPEGSFELVDADGNTIQGERTPGELVYRGPNVMMGYATNVEDLQRGDNQNGLLKTGDIAERDVDGFYYICGRIKRFIKLFGNRVNLDEVEKHLQNVGFHAHVAGRDDLVIIFAESPDIAKRSAEEFCKTFRFHHSAVATHVLDSFPRNESGKLQYSKLMQIFDNRLQEQK